MRYRIDMSYCGAGFCGWQIQPGARTVQGELEKALSVLLRTPVQVVGAGRTDTGVNASHYVAHFDLVTPIPPAFARPASSPEGCIAAAHEGCIAATPEGCIAAAPEGCIAATPEGCIAAAAPEGCIAATPEGCIAAAAPEILPTDGSAAACGETIDSQRTAAQQVMGTAERQELDTAQQVMGTAERQELDTAQQVIGTAERQVMGTAERQELDTAQQVMGTAERQELDTAQLRYKLNAFLPDGIAVSRIAPAAPDFHARFDARRREYTYYLHRAKNPFAGSWSYYYAYPSLDFAAMNAAARHLLGTHDFTCFEKSGGDNKTSICTIFDAAWHSLPSGIPPSPGAPGAFPTGDTICPSDAISPGDIIGLGAPGAFPTGDTICPSDAIRPGDIIGLGAPGAFPTGGTICPSDAIRPGDTIGLGAPGTFPTGGTICPSDTIRPGDNIGLGAPGAFPTGDTICPSDAIRPGDIIGLGAPGAFPTGDTALPGVFCANICDGGGQYCFRIAGDRFLRNMVRAIVGTLLEVGRGKRTPEEFRDLIGSGTRCDAGESVPGHALFLSRIDY